MTYFIAVFPACAMTSGNGVPQCATASQLFQSEKACVDFLDEIRGVAPQYQTRLPLSECVAVHGGMDL